MMLFLPQSVQSGVQGAWSHAVTLHGRGPHDGFVTHSSVSWPFADSEAVPYADLYGLHTES